MLSVASDSTGCAVGVSGAGGFGDSGGSEAGVQPLMQSLYAAVIVSIHCLCSSSEYPPAGGQYMSFERLSFEQLFAQSDLSSAKPITVKERRTVTDKMMNKNRIVFSFMHAGTLR